MALSSIISDIKRDISRKSRFFSYRLHSTSPQGLRRNSAIQFGMEKLEWCDGYSAVKKFEDTFSRFDTILAACDGQTDGHLATA